MTRINQRIERGFEVMARLLCRRSVATLAVMAVLMGALLTQLRHIQFDTSTEGFFRPTDPALRNYNAFRDQFGRDEVIIVAIRTKDVFARAFLDKLKALHAAIEAEVPYLDEVTSLINARSTFGRRDELVVEDLLGKWPLGDEELRRARERALANPLYRNFLLSEDGTLTTLQVRMRAYGTDAAQDVLAGFDAPRPGAAGAKAPARRLLSDKENSEVVRAVLGAVRRFDGPDFPIQVAGSPMVTDLLTRTMQKDMAKFMALALVAIAVFLFALFRRVSAVFAPLFIVWLSLVSTFAVMAALGTPLRTPSSVLPSFLLSVGVGASVHLLTIFYREFDRSGDRLGSIVYAMGHSGLPIVMTSLTTAAGLLSFLTAQVASIAELGIYAAVGVMLALVYTLVMLPAILALLPLRRRVPIGADARGNWADRSLAALGDFATNHAWKVVGVSLLLAVVAFGGIAKLRLSHNTLLWFPKGTPLREATDLIDREMKGSVSLEIVVDTGRKNGLYEPAMLNKLDTLAAAARSYQEDGLADFVGKSLSVTDVVREIHQALNENRPQFYQVPQHRELVAQELLLFENSGNDDLEDMVDTQFSKARLTVIVPWKDAATYVRFVEYLKAEGRRLFGDDATVTVTGLLSLFTRAIAAMMQSTLVSYAIASVVITAMMILLIGRLRLGLLSMVPNFIPIVLTLGLMGWADIPLDMFTLLIGSIAIGLAVDDTIHFMHNFQRYYHRLGDSRRAVHETLQGTGRAMIITSVVLVIGFWLFMLASLNNLFYFGLLTGITLLLALVADLVLSPALVHLATPARPRRQLFARV
ncbi:MAG: MMPL family transporter [Candidatus Lambdaproteobacteria bacterium]|nr:MMPL family transporter [Candidatus Lambdaproteobacteria bacterium]